MKARPSILSVQEMGCRIRQRWLIQNVSFDLMPGFTALVGPNGAGKSTLMRAIAGLMPLTAGTLTMTDASTSRAVAQQVGYIPQFPGSYDNLCAREYLLRTAWWDQPRPLDQISQSVDDVLQRLGLDQVADHPGRFLHPSMRRRVALASVWLRHVQVVLLDEPTAGLDPHERLAFWQELYRLRKLPNSPSAYLISTHLLAEVQSYCDHVLLLAHGRMRTQSSVREFVRTAQGHAFYALEEDLAGSVIDTGRISREGYWVLAPQGTEQLTARRPDIVDAYLWTLNQRFGDETETAPRHKRRWQSSFFTGERP